MHYITGTWAVAYRGGKFGSGIHARAFTYDSAVAFCKAENEKSETMGFHYPILATSGMGDVIARLLPPGQRRDFALNFWNRAFIRPPVVQIRDDAAKPMRYQQWEQQRYRRAAGMAMAVAAFASGFGF